MCVREREKESKDAKRFNEAGEARVPALMTAPSNNCSLACSLVEVGSPRHDVRAPMVPPLRMEAHPFSPNVPVLKGC
jgi:hypothetical protein